jgi:hypothetical protein
MTIKQQGGIFGRNPTFNEVDAASVDINSGAIGGSPLVLTTTANGHNIDMTDTNGTARLRNVGGRLHITADVNDETASSAIRFYVDNTRMVDINDSGNIVFNSSGQGIDFSATSGTGTSELFDDYEEGTFTPVVADAASGGNEATASASNGYYTKIGRSVTVTIDLQNINTSGLTSGNNIFITGLPFSAGSLTGNINYTGLVNGGGTLSSAKSVIAVVFDNVSYIRLVEATSTSVTNWLDVSEINSGATDFRFSVTYFA